MKKNKDNSLKFYLLLYSISLLFFFIIFIIFKFYKAGVYLPFLFVIVFLANVFFVIVIYIQFNKINHYYKNKSIEIFKNLHENSNRQKEYFLNFAHETKTSLALIENYIKKFGDQMKNTVNDVFLLQYFDNVIFNFKKIQKDIVNFLDIEKLLKGQMIYNHDNIIDIKSAIEKQIEMFQDIANSKKIKIIYKLKEAYIKIDPFAFDRIINNLFDNAIKYNKENGKIYVDSIIKDGKVVLTIKDTGVGLNKNQLQNIYKPYNDKSSQDDNINHGMGLGLKMVYSIVNQINAKIKIKSKINSGTSISIIIPEAKIVNEEIIEETSKMPQIIKSNRSDFLNERYLSWLPTIFIVDDNVDLLKYLQVELYEIFNVYYARNGKEALEKINKIPKPDIIISDIVMDEIDGYEFKNTLNEDPNFKAIPFIFLTAKTAHKEKIHGLVKGAVSYITKPFNISELFATICSIIDFSKIQKKVNIEEFQSKLADFLYQSNDKMCYKKNQFEKICTNNNISNSEKEIIKLILQNKEYKEIADELYKSIHTIRNQVQSILKKFNIKNKKELFKIFGPIN